MTRQNVLVVEDETLMQRFYKVFFEEAHRDEFIWFLAQDGDQALGLLASERLDLVVLDWMMPGLSGLTVLKALRACSRTRELGVLMVTAKSAPGDAVLALESGADDYLSKPFDKGVLLARLHSMIRRRQLPMAGHNIFELPGLRWDTLSCRLLIGGRPVHLTPKESDLLRIFLERPDMIHGHSVLWEAVWGYESDGWEHTVVNAVSALRMKLGPKWGNCLEARKRQGFIFHSR